ncbi:MAG: pirin family protein [Deltaproteobacteria bacterium]|nr:MAG: pirin family protein [Deltaproteobacteria bacterium]
MSDAILATAALGFPWQTLDPFLFCVHHLDHYPEGNDEMGPDPSLLRGRRIGMDFEIKDGWRMYHGDVIPGFPRHPHRGFETITLARKGYIDHSDSMGAKARFGNGDVQWMTAGSGVVHSEMFPLVKRDAGNTTELFQIWINLPKVDKMVEPYFTMLWNEQIPRSEFTDDAGKKTEVVTVVGPLGDHEPPPPPPNSWASRPEAEVAVWTLKLEAGAKYTLPGAKPGLHRALYYFEGASLRVAGKKFAPGIVLQLDPAQDVELVAGPEPVELLMLQGRPIGEPVVQHGPFVMNTPGEIRQAMIDYQRTGFGGWPWERDDPVHPRESTRFALHSDGRVEHGG